MGKLFQRKKKTLTKAYSYLRIWLGNGQSFINDFKYPIFLATMLKVWFPTLDLIFLTLLAVIGIIVLILIGWYDMTFIQIAQTQAEISTQKYNPYFRRLERKI